MISNVKLNNFFVTVYVFSIMFYKVSTEKKNFFSVSQPSYVKIYPSSFILFSLWELDLKWIFFTFGRSLFLFLFFYSICCVFIYCFKKLKARLKLLFDWNVIISRFCRISRSWSTTFFYMAIAMIQLSTHRCSSQIKRDKFPTI